MSERRTGLVEVIYGDYSGTRPPRGRAYAYHADEPVGLGDVVAVGPPFWDPHGDPQAATVVRLGSAYAGHAQRILSVVKRHEDGPDAR